MNIMSLEFVLFLFVVFIGYYSVPRKYQYIILLIASSVFYLSFSFMSGIFILLTSLSVYFSTRALQRLTEEQACYLKENKISLSRDEKRLYKRRIQTIRKRIMLLSLLFCVACLSVFKYSHFILEQVNSIISMLGYPEIEDKFHFLVPLGISFYTFQAVGYLLDVYWENVQAEKNYFKVLLFISFFPQIIQGPISEYEKLSKELFTSHQLSYENYAWGGQRMVCGFFKKMVIANTFGQYVTSVFQNYSLYSGPATLIGAFCYSIQIYADFSGYMDIMCGFCQMLGIHLTENFDRPYFSKSVAEYWRRWHISLGAWFKRYIYFPIATSTWSRSLSRATLRFGKHFSSMLPATIALVVTWLATGIWHGASWAYITWGLLNGLFIIVGLWLEPVYASATRLLRIPQNSCMWQMFRIIRTFILVTFIKVLPEVGTLTDGIGLWSNIFTSKVPILSISDILPFIDLESATAVSSLTVACIGVLFMLVFSIIQYREPVRKYFNALPGIIRLVLLNFVIILTIIFGVPTTWNGGGFMYANF